MLFIQVFCMDDIYRLMFKKWSVLILSPKFGFGLCSSWPWNLTLVFLNLCHFSWWNNQATVVTLDAEQSHVHWWPKNRCFYTGLVNVTPARIQLLYRFMQMIHVYIFRMHEHASKSNDEFGVKASVVLCAFVKLHVIHSVYGWLLAYSLLVLCCGWFEIMGKAWVYNAGLCFPSTTSMYP